MLIREIGVKKSPFRLQKSLSSLLKIKRPELVLISQIRVKKIITHHAPNPIRNKPSSNTHQLDYR